MHAGKAVGKSLESILLVMAMVGVLDQCLQL